MTYLKKLTHRIVFKLFSFSKKVYDEKMEKLRLAGIGQNAVIAEGTTISKEASIANYLKEKDKIVIGKGCSIFGDLMLFGHGGEIIIGDHCFVGPGSKIWSAKKIVVGNRVLISHNVNIHDNISHPLNPEERHKDYMYIYSEGALQKTNDLREKEIEIGDDVWVGFNATILKGVKIGNGAIVGANTVVTKDVPAFAVVIGNPQKIIKYIN